MNIHQEILAKSEQNGRICLYQHLKNVADIARVVLIIYVLMRK